MQRSIDGARERGGTVISLESHRRARLAARPDPFPREVVEWFVGETPELLLDVAQSVEHGDAEGVRVACGRLRSRALAVGGLALARLCRMCAARAACGDLSTAATFTDQLESAYVETFARVARGLFGRRQACL